MTVRYRLGERGKVLFIFYKGMYNRWTIFTPETTANDIKDKTHYKHKLIGYGQDIVNMYEKPNLVFIPAQIS